jgi:hypothetical protein
MKAVYKYWAWIVFAAVCLQIGFAGYGAFYVANKVDDGIVDQDGFEDGFGLHMGFGYLVVLMILVFLLIAFAAKVGRQRIIRNAVLFGLGILQILLAWIGGSVPAVGFFHPVNALLIFALSGSLAWTTWQAAKAGAAAPAEPAPTSV